MAISHVSIREDGPVNWLAIACTAPDPRARSISSAAGLGHVIPPPQPRPPRRSPTFADAGVVVVPPTRPTTTGEAAVEAGAAVEEDRALAAEREEGLPIRRAATSCCIEARCRWMAAVRSASRCPKRESTASRRAETLMEDSAGAWSWASCWGGAGGCTGGLVGMAMAAGAGGGVGGIGAAAAAAGGTGAAAAAAGGVIEVGCAWACGSRGEFIRWRGWDGGRDMPSKHRKDLNPRRPRSSLTAHPNVDQFTHLGVGARRPLLWGPRLHGHGRLMALPLGPHLLESPVGFDWKRRG